MLKYLYFLCILKNKIRVKHQMDIKWRNTRSGEAERSDISSKKPIDVKYFEYYSKSVLLVELRICRHVWYTAISVVLWFTSCIKLKFSCNLGSSNW